MKCKVLLALCFFPLALFAQKEFTVTMNIKGLGYRMIKVAYQKNGKSVADTLKPFSPDRILWKGEVVEPHLVRMDVIDTSLYLRLGNAVMAPPQLQFLLTNADIKIQGNYTELFAVEIHSKDAEVSAYEKLRRKDLPIAREIWDLNKEQNRKSRMNDTAGNYQISLQVRALRKKNQELRVQFVNDHPKNFSSILILQSLTLILTPEELGAKFAMIDDMHKNSEAAKNLNTRIEGNKKTAIGKPVIQFAQTGIDGNLVDIAALKGKVILIDFWGSWCVPCRLSHPAMVKLYEKYKSRGLEIVGISNESISGQSIADQEIKWKKAVKDDGINWLHILYNPQIRDIIKEHDINGYPTKYLVDQKGNYVLKLSGNSDVLKKMLEDKLAELLPEINN
jgi:thiol-disulfide isomerase/thioredoxin